MATPDSPATLGDWIQYMKNEGLIVVPKSVMDARHVGGVSFEQYRNRILNKQWLSCLEISRAQLWGPISKKRVYQKVRSDVPEENLQTNPAGTIMVHRDAVRAIAIALGYVVD